MGQITPSGRGLQAENTAGLLSGYGSGSRTPQFAESSGLDIPGRDPIAASMERNRVLLQRMKEQQELAQREMWSESDLSPEELGALEERRERRRQQEEEDDAQLRRAIEESEALAALAEKQRLQGGSDKSEDHHINTGASNSVYDDEDAELQAALKASLEHLSSSSAQSQSTGSDEADSVVSDTTSANEEPEDAVSPILSLDEIRRRRLARFGA